MDELIGASPIPPDKDVDYNRRVSFNRLGILPPSAVYVTLDDQIVLRVWSPTQTTTVNISIRWQGPDGRIIPEFFSVSQLTVGATPFIRVLNPAEGFILSVSIETPNAPRGACFIVLELVRGQGSQDATFGGVLVSGYPGLVGRLGFPGGPILTPLDGRGSLRTIVGGAPAAGAELLDVVPAGRQWILRSTRVVLTTAVAVANRVPSLAVDDGGANIMAQVPMSGLITASLTTSLCWAPGATLSALVGGDESAGWVMECRLLPGWRIRTITTAIQGADQYAAPVYMVEEFVNA